MFLIVLLFFVLFVILSLGLVYLFLRLRDLVLFGRNRETLTKQEKRKSYIIAGIPVLILIALCLIRPHFWIIPMLHLLPLWVILDGIIGLFRRLLAKRQGKKTAEGKAGPNLYHKRRLFSYILTGVLAVTITTVYLGISFYLAHHLYETDYKITTDKNVTSVKIALIADTHIGSSFDGKRFEEHLKKIEKQAPDMLIVAGDFVDELTTKKEMEISCKALGQFKSTYGVFYAPGNHDDGINKYREFSYKDLLTELKKDGVIVLEDEVFPISDDICIVGRKDKDMERLTIGQLMASVDPNCYSIVIDHQPNDYDAEEAAGCDLVLCGHTHGGHMVPIGPVSEIFDVNDATYGLDERGDSTFIVTSGMSNWAIPFKSGAITEYCIIDVNAE